MLVRITLVLASLTTAAAQSNPELAKIYAADQADRVNQFSITPERMAAISKADAPRLQRAREIVAGGGLKTSEDYVRAAFLFQHGTTLEDYLLSHVLGLVATKMDGSGAWIASASLDRYLLNSGKPQVFGLALEDDVPFNKTLIPDSVRAALCVPSVAARAKFLAGSKDDASSVSANPCGTFQANLGKFILTRRNAIGEVENLSLNIFIDKEGDPNMALTGPSIPEHADTQFSMGNEQIQIKVNGEVFDLKLRGDLVTGRYSNATSSGLVVGFR